MLQRFAVEWISLFLLVVSREMCGSRDCWPQLVVIVSFVLNPGSGFGRQLQCQLLRLSLFLVLSLLVYFGAGLSSNSLCDGEGCGLGRLQISVDY
jgi:hypothetical protein